MAKDMRKTLKERAIEMQAQLPIMKDRTKGDTDDLIGVIVDLVDYDFMNKGKEDEYVVFTVKEEPGMFFFGGQVLNERMRDLDKDGFGDEIRKNGLPMTLTTKKSKSNRNYTSVTFYPEG